MSGEESKDWFDHEVGRQGASIARLSDGEGAVIDVIDEPYFAETSESAEAFHVPVRFVNVPETFDDMNDDPISEDEEYNIINSSSGFFTAFRDAVSDPSEVAGSRLEITAHQPNDEATSRYYTVEEV